MVFTLNCFLTLALLSACAEGSDAEATADDAPSTSVSTPTAEAAANTETTAPADDSETGDRAEETQQNRVEVIEQGRAPKTGYDADLFKWRLDADHNGCDTRNDVLRRDLTDITLKAGTKGCVVIAGDLSDEYKGEIYAFDRSPNNIDIDHIVARSNAWQTGAAQFDEGTLKEFGNDPLNLLAVSSGLNPQTCGYCIKCRNTSVI